MFSAGRSSATNQVFSRLSAEDYDKLLNFMDEVGMCDEDVSSYNKPDTLLTNLLTDIHLELIILTGILRMR